MLVPTRLGLLLRSAGALGLLAARPAAAASGAGPQLRALRAGNGAEPWRGDASMLTTLSPTRRAGAAVVRFVLDEPARVTVEAVATAKKRDAVVWSRTRALSAGAHAIEWRPAPDTELRTYLLRITVRDAAGRVTVYGERRGLPAPVARVLGIEASWARRSYVPGQRARLRIEADAAALTLQLFRNGPEPESTNRADELSGVPVSEPVLLDWSRRRGARNAVFAWIGDWPSGLYYAKLTAGDGRVGFAPFVLRPRRLGASRVAVVLPTNTWQAYNLRDSDGDGWGDTWYAAGTPPVVLDRPYLDRGVPPRFKKHERAFLRWLCLTRREVDLLADDDLERIASGDVLRRLYDLVVFPGHTEYTTEHAFDIVERYRDLGGNLLFLSANNFFWKVEKRGGAMRRIGQFRKLGRPEARFIGSQYLANDDGQRQAPFVVRRAARAPWLWDGTGLSDGDTFGDVVGGFGTEIDAVTRHSPRGTAVLAEIPNLFGRGYTAQMAYYETPAGARVFAAGALDFGGAVMHWPMRRMLQNLWNHLAPEEARLGGGGDAEPGDA
jgi:hypothetical protein